MSINKLKVLQFQELIATDVVHSDHVCKGVWAHAMQKTVMKQSSKVVSDATTVCEVVGKMHGHQMGESTEQ